MARVILEEWGGGGKLAKTVEDLEINDKYIFLRDYELRLLCEIADVTLTQGEQIKIDIRKVPVKK